MRKTLKTLLASVAVFASLASPLAASESCGLNVVRSEFRVVETVEVADIARVSWLVEIENTCDRTLACDVYGQFHDDDSFTVARYGFSNVLVPADQTVIFSDLVRTSVSVSEQIDGMRTYFAELERMY